MITPGRRSSPYWWTTSESRNVARITTSASSSLRFDEPWENGTKRQLRADAEEVLRDQLEAAKCGDTTVLNKDLQDLCFNVLKHTKR